MKLFYTKRTFRNTSEYACWQYTTRKYSFNPSAFFAMSYKNVIFKGWVPETPINSSLIRFWITSLLPSIITSILLNMLNIRQEHKILREKPLSRRASGNPKEKSADWLYGSLVVYINRARILRKWAELVEQGKNALLTPYRVKLNGSGGTMSINSLYIHLQRQSTLHDDILRACHDYHVK